eukprot:IDg19270t1
MAGMSGFGGMGGFGGGGGMQNPDEMRLMQLMQEMQMTDSLRMYNELVERCFGECVDSFRSRKLDGKEDIGIPTFSLFRFKTVVSPFWISRVNKPSLLRLSICTAHHASSSSINMALKQSESVPVPEGYLRLISSDGYEFLVEQKYAEISPVIKMMMKVDFKESRTREIRLPEAEGAVLEILCQYLYHEQRNSTLKTNAKDKEAYNIEKFVPPGMEIKLMLFASL